LDASTFEWSNNGLARPNNGSYVSKQNTKDRINWIAEYIEFLVEKIHRKEYAERWNARIGAASSSSSSSSSSSTQPPPNESDGFYARKFIDAKDGQEKDVLILDGLDDALFTKGQDTARKSYAEFAPDLVYARMVAGFLDGELSDFITIGGKRARSGRLQYIYRFTLYLDSYFNLTMQNIRSVIDRKIRDNDEWHEPFIAFETLYHLDSNNITPIANYTAFLITNRLSITSGYRSSIQVSNQNDKASQAFDQILMMLHKHRLLDREIKKQYYIE
jgi:hypothetical protein